MIDSLLKARLQAVADRQRQLQLWSKLAACWAIAAIVGLGLVALQRQGGWPSMLALPVIALLGVAAAVIVTARHRRAVADWRTLATQIEAHHPELDGRLLTAVQQPLQQDGQMNYLQDRLVQEAVRHSHQTAWPEIIPNSRVRTAKMTHLLSLVLFAVVLFELGTPGGHGRSLFARTSAAG